MAVTTIPSAGLTLGSQVNFRNLIINGDMSIAQRGTSFSPTGDAYVLDRFKLDYAGSPAVRYTITQDTDVPTGQGFAKSMKFDVTTAEASPSATTRLWTRLEGQNLQQLKYGTSNAESLTLSFWVKSNLTGTFIFWLYQEDGSNRSISKSYTINSANTWEKKTITIDGDTSGQIDNDNGSALRVVWFLTADQSAYGTSSLQTSWGSYDSTAVATGQTNVGSSTSNEWYITGVQLEVGTSASDFEFLPHDVNLVRCQRYYQQLNQNGSNGWCTFSAIRNGSADVQNIGIPLPTPLRIGNPTVTKSSSSLMQAWDGDGYHITSSGGSGSMTVPVNSGNDTPYLMLNTNGFSGLDHGGTVSWSIVLGTPSAEFDAEL